MIKMLPYAIVDTSVLLSLTELDLLQYLKLFYQEVRVPRQVEREFIEIAKATKNKRYAFLMSFYESNRSWFIPCNEYESALVELYLTNKKLDRGEAEVLAQNQALGSVHELLLDEKEGRKAAQKDKAQYHGVLYILARLDLNFKICNYFESIALLRDKGINNRMTDSLIRQVYDMVAQSR